MTDPERMHLLAIRSSLVAAITNIDAMLKAEQLPLPTQGDGACAHPLLSVRTIQGGFGSNEVTRICGLCGDTVQ